MAEYVYHITTKSNEDSIDKNGLIINHNQTNHDYYTKEQIFLGFNPNDCIELVSDMIEDNLKPKEDLILYRIPIDKLDLDEIGYDFNMKLDDYDDIISFTYHKDIEPSVIEKIAEIPLYKDYDIKDYLTLKEMRRGLYGESASDIANKLIDIYEDNFGDIDKENEEETANYLYELEQYEKV